jgi:hypothetical protein
MRILRTGALILGLEMSGCAPISRHVPPPLRGPLWEGETGVFDMFAIIARWSHNTLLLAMALLTAALVVFAI